MSRDLSDFRSEIDLLDIELVKLIARRFSVVEAIAILKSEKDMPVFDQNRIGIVQDRVADLARESGLSPEIARRLWKAIINEAILLEETIIENKTDD